VPYNRVPSDDVVRDAAVVVVEPVAANMGLVPPAEGFLAGLRAACDRAGALLLFDEVITGFRLGPSGASGWSGVQPDLWTFGKVIGGGLPIGAFGGSRSVMGCLAPLGPVYQAGTLSGNPLAVAAGLTVLHALSADDGWGSLAVAAGDLADGLQKVFASAGLAVQVPRVGPLVGLFFSAPSPVGNYDAAQESASSGEYATFFRGMLSQGIALAPGPYEILFPSLAHSAADIEATLEAAASVVASGLRVAPG